MNEVAIKDFAFFVSHRNANRGAQRFVFVGSKAKIDFGRGSTHQLVLYSIGEVDTANQRAGTLQATEIRSSDSSLGDYYR